MICRMAFLDSHESASASSTDLFIHDELGLDCRPVFARFDYLCSQPYQLAAWCWPHQFHMKVSRHGAIRYTLSVAFH